RGGAGRGRGAAEAGGERGAERWDGEGTRGRGAPVAVEGWRRTQAPVERNSADPRAIARGSSLHAVLSGSSLLSAERAGNRPRPARPWVNQMQESDRHPVTEQSIAALHL
ncbi:Protein of unknown function, partial [Gryllus bimaculatus]